MTNKLKRFLGSFALASIVISGQAFLMASMPNPYASAADKNSFTVSEPVVREWLDSYANQTAFLTWAQDTLTQNQVVSLEDLILDNANKSDEDKLNSVRKVIQLMEIEGVDDVLIKGRLTTIEEDLIKVIPVDVPDSEVEPAEVFNSESPKNEE